MFFGINVFARPPEFGGLCYSLFIRIDSNCGFLKECRLFVCRKKKKNVEYSKIITLFVPM